MQGLGRLAATEAENPATERRREPATLTGTCAPAEAHVRRSRRRQRHHVILPPWLMYSHMESFWRSWIFVKRSCCKPTRFNGKMIGLLLGRTSKREPKMRSACGTTPCASARSRVRLTATSMPAYSVEQWTSCGLKKSGICSRSTLCDWNESRSYQSNSSCSMGHSRLCKGNTSSGCQRTWFTSIRPMALKRFTAISMRSLTQTGVMFCVAATRVSSPWKRQMSL
mmetsp:Transcript_68562/g.198972  ORF Transcript_68562/g.198972 Transcript_68562/m.198972 type:complete len:225 (+) Transcript_68562:120-794(+)